MGFTGRGCEERLLAIAMFAVTILLPFRVLGGFIRTILRRGSLQAGPGGRSRSMFLVRHIHWAIPSLVISGKWVIAAQGASPHARR